MSEQSGGIVESAFVGQEVAVTRWDTRDTYYGTLVAADAAFVLLSDFRFGWHGEAGWWPHGKGDRIGIPTANVREITPQSGRQP